MALIYSARWLLPISSPPMDDGAIAIEGPTIMAVGPISKIKASFPDAPVTHFRDSAMLPGFVNAHSHLELTVMRGFLENEETDFFAWLRKLTIARLAMTNEDLFVSSMCGAIEAARAGITCLGDSSSFAVQSMRALKEIGLRSIVYQESFGPDAELAAGNFARLRDQVAEMLGSQTAEVRAGVSPHAPYTVSGPQLEMISRLAIDESLPLMMHAAESEAERSFLTEGTGPFADGLQTRGIEWRAPGVSTIQYLRRHGVLDTRPLLAHCINVDEADLELIKAERAGVAHCPKSNAKLGHGRAPFRQFIKAGINVGLGSDSVASNNTCDILEEARFATLLTRLDRDADSINAEQALYAATLGGARAMGLDDRIGSLEEGKQADLAIVGLRNSHQSPASSPVEALIFSSSGRDVILTVVAGKEIYRENHLTTVNENDLLTRVRDIRSRLEPSA
ncbi:MAG TPA: amidohydrolase family protein [Pyrinomonadaceae bacterium]|nr:amidohydrolase family protein [Pyrinomonadaceae bacterium]